MINITSQEAKELNKLGVQYGEGGISKTHNHHRKSYYLCESRRNMSLLNKMRQKPVIYTKQEKK